VQMVGMLNAELLEAYWTKVNHQILFILDLSMRISTFLQFTFLVTGELLLEIPTSC
jgi:hypothetical protein